MHFRIFIVLTSLLLSELSISDTTLSSVSIKDVILNMETGIHFKINESHDQ